MTDTRPRLLPLIDAAAALQLETVDLRRRLHRHPEQGLALPWTQATVAEALRELGLAPILGDSVGSVVGVIDGSHPGPTVLLRADMDALPLIEDTGLPFASEIRGTMHACGHDTHVAMLVGAARLLAERRDAIRGRVLLMFQPGEEGYHGARVMLDEGLIRVAGDAPLIGAYAVHISTAYASGTINLRSGALLAAADTIRIRVVGRGGHASAPHQALDPITVAAEIVLGLQTMVARRVDVFDPAVVTIAHIDGGTTTNIIPETVLLEGTMRTVSEDTRIAVRTEVRRVAEGIAAAHGATVELEIEAGYPVTYNDADASALARAVALDLVGPESLGEMAAPIMGAEDFSYVLQQVPGAMVFLGAREPDEDPAMTPANHSNRVTFQEPAMATGVAWYAAVAIRALEEATGAPS
jgi:amidohydrolase